MSSRRTSSSILSFGTALLLTLPAPALAAAPDPGIDWQAEVAARKAKPGRSATRPAKRTPKPPRPTPTPDATDVATPEPTTDVATPEPTTDVATPEPTDVATPEPDPVAATRDPTTDVPPPAIATANAPPAPAVAPRRPPPAASTATLTRRARAELVTGSLLAAGGFAALGVLANGLYVHRISERELARGGAYPPELLAPIERQHDRSETRIAAGAVAGVVGLGLGAALIAAGVRELRLTRRAHARIRVAPTLTGLQLSGRF